MGLLLSVLVFSVGVVEALSVYDRFRSGYLPLSYQRGRQHSQTISDVLSKLESEFSFRSARSTVEDDEENSSTLCLSDNDCRYNFDLQSQNSDDDSLIKNDVKDNLQSEIDDENDNDSITSDDTIVLNSQNDSLGVDLDSNVVSKPVLTNGYGMLAEEATIVCENTTKPKDSPTPESNFKPNVLSSLDPNILNKNNLPDKNVPSVIPGFSGDSIEDSILFSDNSHVQKSPSKLHRSISEPLFEERVITGRLQIYPNSMSVDEGLNDTKNLDKPDSRSKKKVRFNLDAVQICFEKDDKTDESSFATPGIIKRSIVRSSKKKSQPMEIQDVESLKDSLKRELQFLISRKDELIKNMASENINVDNDLPQQKVDILNGEIHDDSCKSDEAQDIFSKQVVEDDQNKQTRHIEEVSLLSMDVEIPVSVLDSPEKSSIKISEEDSNSTFETCKAKRKDLNISNGAPDVTEMALHNSVCLKENLKTVNDSSKADDIPEVEKEHSSVCMNSKQVVDSSQNSEVNQNVSDSKPTSPVKKPSSSNDDSVLDIRKDMSVIQTQEITVIEKDSMSVRDTRAGIPATSDENVVSCGGLLNNVSSGSESSIPVNNNEIDKNNEATEESIENESSFLVQNNISSNVKETLSQGSLNDKDIGKKITNKSLKQENSMNESRKENNESVSSKSVDDVEKVTIPGDKMIRTSDQESNISECKSESVVESRMKDKKDVDKTPRKRLTKKDTTKSKRTSDRTTQSKTLEKMKYRLRGELREASGTESEEDWGVEEVSDSFEIESDNEAAQAKTSTSEARKRQMTSDETVSPDKAFWLIFSGEYTKAMSKDWHSSHFCCWQCDESLTGQRYVLREEHPYCIKCYESVFANSCEECSRIIGIDSKDLSYKDKHWHEACFLCSKCRVSLVDKQFGSKADKIYCGNCYDAQFASRCDGCGQIFRAGTKKMEYKTRQWHEQCFCCCVCKSPIGTKSFIPREQEIYCATCYEEKFATRCVKCNKIITSGGVTYKNEPWHRECFTCTNCGTSLAGQRFTSREDKPYCAECFGELFAKRCTACCKPITGIGGTRFISFEDRHWHNDCFICAACKTSLVGRGFITDGEDIICPECAKQKLM